MCLKLAQLGYHIVVNYKGNEEQAAITVRLVEATGGSAELLKFDVARKEEIASVLGGWLEANKEKTVEVLVNNAGIKEDALMIFMKDEQWESVVSTSLDGFFYVTRLIINQMAIKRYGRIINVVSLSGLKGLPGQVNYSAAKAGVIGGTKALAQEVGKRGITVNAVAPGFIKTDMTEGLDEKELRGMIPVNRFGTPEEVAHAVAFLASRESGYITGTVLSVNGGLYS